MEVLSSRCAKYPVYVLFSVQQVNSVANTALLHPLSTRVHYILSGTFNTVFLYLLAFNPLTPSLSISQVIRAEGPHQFLALSQDRSRAYATTWAMPPTLSSWEVLQGGLEGIKHINTVPVRATSSYIQVSSIQPRIYSAGGPTGEVHDIDAKTGGFGKKLQELLYVPEEELETTDKTRVALRYGSHSIDLDFPKKQAFVPHLFVAAPSHFCYGHNSIYMYSVLEDGTFSLIAEVPSFGDGHDGPRHVIPSPDGNKLYAVTEHTSYVDVYTILSETLKHEQRLSVIPSSFESTRLDYRGDTLRLSQSGRFLYATTRGKTSATKGFVSTWAVNDDGTLGSSKDDFEPLDRFVTSTSGGKANAVEAFPFHVGVQGGKIKEDRDWVLLTDDQDGWVWVLEWDGVQMRELCGVQLGGQEGAEKDEGTGASHAVWLS
ncbi:BQ5605_C002g01208 [Microbotryum silenes-dioicae]|uniref:BQ5605_C002g01208 protein n=1 Tax=Microbotryum silenes-dioicae TaxID=796604 RepID=A0A2X0P186_9BASI|nr:BQ5605_C002g01208 [Microbotryum silenes-dioicae]